MTVLQVIPRLETGGAERACLEVADALRAEGHRALVAGAPGRLCGPLERTGAEFLPFDGEAKSPVALWRNAGWLTRLIREREVDIVHARSRAPAWSARLAARRTGRAFVTTYHGVYSETNALKRLYNSVMVSGDRVIANSGFTADLIRARYRIDERRLATVDRGIDAAAFDPGRIEPARVARIRKEWGVAPETRAIVLAGRLTSWKGQAVLIRAAAGLAGQDGPDFRVVLVGSDQGRQGYRLELEGLVRDLGLDALVHFAGHSDDVPAVFAAADIAVSASTRPEAFGRAIVEAQAMQVPVIATRLGPTGETVLAPPRVADGERTGWIVPPNEPDALAEALREALALRGDALAEIGVRGRRHVVDRFTVGRMTARTLAVYRDVLGEQMRSSTVS